MRIRWSHGAEDQRDKAKLEQPSPARLLRLERKLRKVLEQLEMFPESAPPFADYGRPDIRMIPVEEYRMSYMLVDDEIIIISFVPARSSSAHD